MENCPNNFQTELLLSAPSGATELVVLNSPPDAPPFRVLVGSELFRVTSITDNVWQVEHALEGTPIEHHPAGQTVTAILTQAGLEQFIADRKTPQDAYLCFRCQTPGAVLNMPTGVATVMRYGSAFSDDLAMWDTVNHVLTPPYLGRWLIFATIGLAAANAAASHTIYLTNASTGASVTQRLNYVGPNLASCTEIQYVATINGPHPGYKIQFKNGHTTDLLTQNSTQLNQLTCVFLGAPA